MRQDGIHYTLQFDVADGNMADFEALTDKAIAYAEGETGTIVYRWLIKDSNVQLHERFTDEASMLEHLGGPAATEIFPALMKLAAVTRFDVHGDPSPDATAGLEGFGAAIFRPWKGFDR